MPPPFDCRKLRHEVVIQTEATPTPDGQGGTADPWTTIGTYRAHVEPLSGRELFNAQQAKALTTHKITMRIVGDIDPTQRLTIPATGQVFNITEVLRYNEQVPYYVLMAVEQFGETAS